MKKDGISRRDFLKGAAAGVAGMAMFGAMGCASPAAEETEAGSAAKETQGSTEGVAGAAGEEPSGAQPEAGQAQYEVYHTELLIIGTGSAGTWAAQRALERGKKIMMVEKGPFRHGGASAMSWDAWMLWWDYCGFRHKDWMLIDGEIPMKAWNYLGGLDFNPHVESINHGQTLPWRDENGMPKPESEALPWAVCSAFFRREMDDIFESGRVDIMDQTMITDLLINEGRCLGAIGIYLPTGAMRVIRADATIMACAGTPQFHGWLSIGYRGINSTDNTGDVAMAAFRKGITIGEAEFAQYDFNSIVFEDVAHTFGCGIGADAGELEILYDGNHERIFSDEEIPTINGNLGMCQRIGRLVFEEGKGSPHDGVYVRYDEHSFDNVRYPIMRNVRFFQENGYEPQDQYTEVAAEMYEHGGAPVIDSNMMTEWKGLFDVRGAGACGENGGPHCMHNRLYGHYTGNCAADYLDQAEPVDIDQIDWSGVEEEYRRLMEIRTRKVENGLRPHEIRRKIQAAGYRGFTIYRSTEMMEEAIAELERIRREDMPRQVLADDSTTYNMEWKSAIENYNLLDCAEVSIRASLLREETRGAYLRPEFPERDDENWNCMLACHMENGEMIFEKRPYPALES